MGEPTRILCVDGDAGILDSLGKLLRRRARVPRRPLRRGRDNRPFGDGSGARRLGRASGCLREGTEFLAEVRRLRRRRSASGCTAKRTRRRPRWTTGSSTNRSPCRSTGRRCGHRGERTGTVPPRGGPAGKGGGCSPLRRPGGGAPGPVHPGALRPGGGRRPEDRLGPRAARRGEGRAAMRRVAHDCGKIGVPEAILNHPGKLSPEQFAVVKRHPRWGAEVAGTRDSRTGSSTSFSTTTSGRRGRLPLEGMREGNPLAARIVAVADVFDATTADRPYARGYDGRRRCA